MLLGKGNNCTRFVNIWKLLGMAKVLLLAKRLLLIVANFGADCHPIIKETIASGPRLPFLSSHECRRCQRLLIASTVHQNSYQSNTTTTWNIRKLFLRSPLWFLVPGSPASCSELSPSSSGSCSQRWSKECPTMSAHSWAASCGAVRSCCLRRVPLLLGCFCY